MKTYFLIIISCLFCLFLLSCKQEIEEKETSACGVDNPAKNLLWLAELIEKAENDKAGHYMGQIWLESYKGKDVFVTDMMLGSGGIAYWFFDCSGNHFLVEDVDIQSFVSNMKLDVIIYSSF